MYQYIHIHNYYFHRIFYHIPLLFYFHIHHLKIYEILIHIPLLQIAFFPNILYNFYFYYFHKFFCHEKIIYLYYKFQNSFHNSLNLNLFLYFECQLYILLLLLCFHHFLHFAPYFYFDHFAHYNLYYNINFQFLIHILYRLHLQRLMLLKFLYFLGWESMHIYIFLNQFFL